jgi:hypothetical protein
MKRYVLTALPLAAALATVLAATPAAFAAGTSIAAAPHKSAPASSTVRPADCDPNNGIHAAICLPPGDIPDGTYDLTGSSNGQYFYYNSAKSYLFSTPLYMGQSFTKVSA